jgi:hypothetical protein
MSFFTVETKNTKNIPIHYFWKHGDNSQFFLDHIEFSVSKEEWNTVMKLLIQKLKIMKSENKDVLLV